MARERQLFGPGAFDDAIIGNFFIAVSDVDTPPTGWNKMDGATIPNTDGKSNFPNLTGSYLNGGSALDLVERGEFEHTHIWPSGVTSLPSGPFAHLLSGASNVATRSSPGAVSQVRDDHDHETQVPVVTPHDPNDHVHTHQINNVVENNVTPSGKISHLPETEVINWIGRQLTVTELKVLDKGTIFGFMGKIVDIPAEWAHCNGQNGTPDIRNRVIRCGDTLTTEGSDLHRSKHTYFSDPAGVHNHGGVTSTETGTQTGDTLAFGPEIAVTPHNHTITSPVTDIDHQHFAALTQDSVDQVDLKPPHRTMIFIQKTAAADPILIDTTAIGVHVFFNPNELSPGVLWTSVSGISDKFENKYLVGRKVLFPPFDNLGSIGALQHRHTVDFGTSTDGVHAHNIISVLELILGVAGAVTLPSPTHTHTTSSDGGHDHPTTGSLGVNGDNKPATIELELFKKVL